MTWTDERKSQIRNLLTHMHDVMQERSMKLFHIRFSFETANGEFGFTFAERGSTPKECVTRAMNTFFEGLTESEKELARNGLRFSCTTARDTDSLPLSFN
jgi:hypothetical protein